MLNATPPWPMTLKNSLQIVCKHIKYYLGIRTIVSICWYGMNFSFRRQCSLGDNSKWVQTLVWCVNFLLNDHTLNCLLESGGKKVHFLGVLPKTQVSGLRLQHKGEMGYKDFLHLLLIFLPYLRIFQNPSAISTPSASMYYLNNHQYGKTFSFLEYFIIHGENVCFIRFGSTFCIVVELNKQK